MKFELFKNMLKEEIRLHTSLYHSSSFFSFPLVIGLFTLFITLGFHNLTTGEFQANNIIQIMLLIFFASGIMAGTFGLQARDYLERRFGEFGKLINNSLLLPINLKTLFIIASVKDIVFYLLWFLLPVIIGYTIANLILQNSILNVPILFISIFFSFVYGVFTSFFLTFLYERSKLVFSLVSLIILIGLVLLSLFSEFSSIFIPEIFYNDPSIINLILLLIFAMILFFMIYTVVGKEYKSKITRSVNVKSVSFSNKFDTFLVKDFIDLKRTGGLFSKPFFNVFLPSLFILFIFSSVKYLTEFQIGILFFAIIIGTLSTSLLNSLITSDSVAYYKFLPITLKQHISNKFLLTIIISLFQGTILLIIFGLLNNEFNLVLESVLLFTMFLIYNLNLNFYLTGLNPNEFLLNARIFVTYALLLVPIMVIAMIISIIFIEPLWYFVILFGILIGLSKLLFNHSLKKWENMEELK